MMRLYDAHNHLQAAELAPYRDGVIAATRAEGIVGMVVNGTCEEDWAEVAALADRLPEVRASHGVHPWKVDDVSVHWRERLCERLDAGGGLGEIGLDRWKTEGNFDAQLEIFRWQLAEGARRDLPTTIHCLRAWGAMREILSQSALPARGFLLHAYGGSGEMAREMAELGGYFSFSGSFLAAGRERKLEPFREIALDRLLVETDAPSMPTPASLARLELPRASDGGEMHHPANLRVAYEGLAALRGLPLNELAAHVEENFRRFFGWSVLD